MTRDQLEQYATTTVVACVFIGLWMLVNHWHEPRWFRLGWAALMGTATIILVFVPKAR